MTGQYFIDTSKADIKWIGLNKELTRICLKTDGNDYYSSYKWVKTFSLISALAQIRIMGEDAMFLRMN